ncbi:MAG: glycosyltransferase [Asgard group archaeon]|nr:glycosyltransferase [Asgard group archaeon]
MIYMVSIWLTILNIIYLVFFVIALVYYLYINIRKKDVLNDDYLKSLGKEPFVSIIVPTYNEENNIKKCLKSLKSLNYSNYEIILSDGGSQDRTVEIAKPFVDKLIVENEVAEGWIGKNYGCHLGSEVADGELLLFTDADTWHKPDSLRITVSILLREKAGLYTMLPYQEMKKWWESIVPIYFFLSHITSGGIKRINDPREHDSFLGIGQYLLFTRDAYTKIGGHVRIKGSIIEDYAFARIVKMQLHSLYYSCCDKMVHVQMYPDSFQHCWTGFKKVLYAGTKLTPPRKITIALIVSLLTIAAPVMIILNALLSDLIAWPIIMANAYFLMMIAFATFWHNKGRHFWVTYLLFPFLMIFFIFTMISSTLELVISKQTTWKGRKYKPNLRAGINGPSKNDDSSQQSKEKNHSKSKL